MMLIERFNESSMIKSHVCLKSQMNAQLHTKPLGLTPAMTQYERVTKQLQHRVSAAQRCA